MHHVPRKRFGQNFLVDAQVVRLIVDALGLRADDNVVEIGPGQGALTGPLLQRLEHLTVVELDRDLVARLARQFSPEKLTIHGADALDFDFSVLGANLRVIGNLPYNISTPLLFHLAAFADRLADIKVMLQKEVVDRIVAEPSTPDYGRLSVMLQYRFGVAKLCDVPPDAFWPRPKVQSAVVRLVPRPAADLGAHDQAVFGAVVADAFSQRRKMLRNTLARWLGENELAALSIDPTWRGERLSVADYVRIANACAPSAAK
jgi:16S rRNA (adenine1518-N6/adenine1519-N6)-dimethyltransferase